MMIRFLIYGLLGWSLEIFWTGLCDLFSGDINMMGHSSVWMLLIYGFGGICFEFVHNKISGRSWYERGLIWTYLIFSVEFVSGAILSLFKIYAWEYDSLFSIMGFIRLDYAPLWFCVGLLFEKIHLFSQKIISYINSA